MIHLEICDFAQSLLHGKPLLRKRQIFPRLAKNLL